MKRLWMTVMVGACVLGLTAQEPDRTLRPQQDSTPAVVPSGEKRIALVIGNAGYKAAPLKNPVNDARAVAEALKNSGFAVTRLEDATRTQMREAIRTFGARIAEGGVGLFYFAGHGMQVKGRNYLVPTGADIATEDEVAGEAVEVDAILAKMETARNRLNILILDACRNNPFGRSFRSSQQGLAQVDAPTGTFVAFATAPGRTAADGSGANGLYTEALLRQFHTPGLKLEEVFKRTRADVLRLSSHQQTPWENSSIVGDFYFVTTGTPLPSGQEGMVAIATDQPPLVPQVLAADAPLEMRETEGRIVFFRKSRWIMGKAGTYEIEMSGKRLGTLRSGEYFNVKVPSGKLKFSLIVEQWSDRGKPKVFHVKVKPGEPVYVSVDLGDITFVPMQEALPQITKLKNIGDERSD